MKNFFITADDGKTYDTMHYNLDVIIALGYRVHSMRATKFRIWATQRLKEYIIKGFTMDDERLKQGGGRARYFEELLQRVRDIRASERNFYQKVTDIYATSVDYRKDDALTKIFLRRCRTKCTMPCTAAPQREAKYISDFDREVKKLSDPKQP